MDHNLKYDYLLNNNCLFKPSVPYSTSMVILCYNLPIARPWLPYRNAKQAVWHGQTGCSALPNSPFCNAKAALFPTAWSPSSWQQRRHTFAIYEKTLRRDRATNAPPTSAAHPDLSLQACRPLASYPLCSS